MVLRNTGMAHLATPRAISTGDSTPKDVDQGALLPEVGEHGCVLGPIARLPSCLCAAAQDELRPATCAAGDLPRGSLPRRSALAPLRGLTRKVQDTRTCTPKLSLRTAYSVPTIGDRWTAFLQSPLTELAPQRKCSQLASYPTHQPSVVIADAVFARWRRAARSPPPDPLAALSPARCSPRTLLGRVAPPLGGTTGLSLRYAPSAAITIASRQRPIIPKSVYRLVGN
jgi:hypothetical protein